MATHSYAHEQAPALGPAFGPEYLMNLGGHAMTGVEVPPADELLRLTLNPYLGTIWASEDLAARLPDIMPVVQLPRTTRPLTPEELGI